MNTFYKLLGSGLIASTTNNFVWFALTFWIYLSTKSVISTAFVGGIYLVATVLCGFWFGSIVDHHKKKNVMIGSSLATLLFFSLGFILYLSTPLSMFTSITNPVLWIFAILLMGGVVAGNLYNIALPTLVTALVPEDRRDKANGLFGTMMGVSFAITSVASGFVLAYGGMFWVLCTALAFTVVAAVYLLSVSVPEAQIIHVEGEKTRRIDIRGTIAVIKTTPGLFSLIFFATFNNFLGGTFMALMDAYGLSLVSVQVWGTIWGFLSLGFIAGGLLIAKWGLGSNPVRTLLRINVVTWIVCIFFTIQPSLILLITGMMIWMCLFPFIEATEQTIIQKVVPPAKQGRVFGFAQSVEQAASPLTAFLIGPLTQLIFIPFMTTGKGVQLIGDWFGVGTGRGIALVFVVTGTVGLIVTLLALRSRAFTLLSKSFLK